MKLAVERRAAALARHKEFLENQNDIDRSAKYLGVQLTFERKLKQAKEHYAVSRIQGIVRGFLARILATWLRLELRSTIKIQSLVRGKLGRIRWVYEYWKKHSVVKSAEQLKEILNRSKFIREAVAQKGYLT